MIGFRDYSNLDTAAPRLFGQPPLVEQNHEQSKAWLACQASQQGGSLRLGTSPEVTGDYMTYGQRFGRWWTAAFKRSFRFNRAG
jgi:hypothetical protein